MLFSVRSPGPQEILATCLWPPSGNKIASPSITQTPCSIRSIISKSIMISMCWWDRRFMKRGPNQAILKPAIFLLTLHLKKHLPTWDWALLLPDQPFNRQDQVRVKRLPTKYFLSSGKLIMPLIKKYWPRSLCEATGQPNLNMRTGSCSSHPGNWPGDSPRKNSWTNSPGSLMARSVLDLVQPEITG